MSTMSELTGNDKRHLTWSLQDALKFIIENDERIKNVADHFSDGDYSQAFYDIMEKGLNEMETMCDMDDRLDKTDEAMMDAAPSMPNTTSMYTTLNTPRW